MTASDSPPGPRKLPLLGNTHQWTRGPCDFREQCAEQYGPVVNYELMGVDAYMLTDPDEVERVLTERNQFPKHQATNDLVLGMLGNGLITNSGKEWKQDREAIQPAFYMSAIKRYADIMVDRTEERMESWDTTTPLAMKEEMMVLTLDILTEAMFGPIDLEARGLYRIVEELLKPTKTRNQVIAMVAPDWVPLPFLQRGQNALEEINGQIYEIIDSRRNSQNDADRKELLSMLLATGMSDERIRDQMLTFIFAGHRTTALTLTYVWDLLSRNPEAEARLHAELETVLGGDLPTAEDLSDLEYTEQVVREVLRLYPPVHEVRREPVSDVVINGYTIPEGALVVLPTWVMHRDERFWDDPTLFRPKRWSNEEPNGRDRPASAYFPFGMGPRHCIGKQFALVEAQLVVATIAQEYTFERRYDDLAISPGLALQPKHTVELMPQATN
ncbi:cytochrome P450 (plasmid) [Haloferax sp. S1W]|uniref:cytochrome P450 n=1 Tax=Haloferax sp. S1W TaxID=3377110 RepID=UPI0037C80DDF